MEKFIPSVKLKVARHLVLAGLLLLGVCGISLTICNLALVAAPGQVNTRSRLSQEAASVFQSKLMELSATGPAKGNLIKPVVITDAEVNSFIKYDRPQFLPPGVTDVSIHFKPEGVAGGGNVNFDELKAPQQLGDQLAARLLASIFKGTQHVTALGVIDSENGTGKLTVKNVRIGNTALSDWLVNWFVQNYVQSQYKVDVSKPFLLPDHVSHIEFAPGKAIFVRGTKR